MEVGESECLHVGVRALCMELQRLCARVTAQLVVPGVLKVSHREAARLAGGVMRFPCCRWEIILPCFFVFFAFGFTEELQKQLVEQVELRKKLEREFQHLKGRKKGK